MSKKQTAVEWYANRLCDIEIAYNQGLIDTEVYIESKIHAYDQAKEMEKEQNKILIDALKDIQNWDEEHEKKWDDPGDRAQKALKNYNETYGGKNEANN